MLTSSNFTSCIDFVKKNFRVVKMFLFAAVLVFAFSVNGHAEEAGSQNPAEGTTQAQEETTTEQKVTPVIKNGLVEENGKYYFYKDGKKLKKVWKTVNGKKYYFKKNGQALPDFTSFSVENSPLATLPAFAASPSMDNTLLFCVKFLQLLF